MLRALRRLYSPYRLLSVAAVRMIALIKDLDNPFGYYERRGAGSTQDVSLKPVRETVARLRALCEMREVGGETGETESAEPALGEMS